MRQVRSKCAGIVAGAGYHPERPSCGARQESGSCPRQQDQSEAKGLGKSHIDEFLNQIDDAYDGIIPENPVIEGNKLVKVT